MVKKGEKNNSKGRLFYFFGLECVHCESVRPLVDKLEKELKVKVERIEVWHNSANAKELEKLDNGKCGGVPFFYNEKTGDWLCGAVPYNELKSWALGKK